MSDLRKKAEKLVTELEGYFEDEREWMADAIHAALCEARAEALEEAVDVLKSVGVYDGVCALIRRMAREARDEKSTDPS